MRLTAHPMKPQRIAAAMEGSHPVGVQPNSSPWHAGERTLQERVGVRKIMELHGGLVIRDHMPDEHRELFGTLPFFLVGSTDTEGRVWASIVTGRPGFVVTPDARTLHVAARPIPGDPLAGNLHVGAAVGLLGIQLETRRRNRVNGPVLQADDNGFTVGVQQSFGNCPKYIWAREPVFVRPPEVAGSHSPQQEGPVLSESATEQIAQADTFFIASAAPGAGRGNGVDISHRGGTPGFVRITGSDRGTVLTWPDFSGNRFFNTLGNLVVNPHAGLLFIDFRTGTLLSLTGEAEAVWEGAELAAFEGAERLVRFTVDHGVRFEDALPLRWVGAGRSPALEQTGSWEEVGQIANGDSNR